MPPVATQQLMRRRRIQFRRYFNRAFYSPEFSPAHNRSNNCPYTFRHTLLDAHNRPRNRTCARISPADPLTFGKKEKRITETFVSRNTRRGKVTKCQTRRPKCILRSDESGGRVTAIDKTQRTVPLKAPERARS